MNASPLIAIRGEILCRIVRTARPVGTFTVAICLYGEAKSFGMRHA